MLGDSAMRTELQAYIARDRLMAMVEGSPLPSRARGTALYADISGFSRLAESLAQELGQRAGAEELTRQINLCYERLVDAVHRYRGAVISFSGDAITCWFDGDAGWQAAASALLMQESCRDLGIQQTGGHRPIRIALKIAVVAGTVRRFCVGNEG